MGKRIAIAFIILFTSLAANAASYSDWWQAGNKYYQQKEYDSAAFYYEKIAATHPHDAVVYYNLGNTYYRLNKIGPAVLNYERALQINPEMKEAKDNLVLTQNRITNRVQAGNDIFFVEWWHNWTQGANATMWAVISLIIFLLILALLLIKRLRRNSTPLPPQIIGILAACFTIFFVFSFVSANNRMNINEAVVMQNDAPLVNDAKNKNVALVPEGTRVYLLQQRGEWQQVRLPDGRSGWIQQTLLTRI